MLLIEVEGRQGLAQLFDTPPLPYSEERRSRRRPAAARSSALAVDAEAALLEYLEMFYNLRRAGAALRSSARSTSRRRSRRACATCC